MYSSGTRLLFRRARSSLALPAAVVLGLAVTEGQGPASVDSQQQQQQQQQRRRRSTAFWRGAALMEAAAAADAEHDQPEASTVMLAGKRHHRSLHPCSQQGQFVRGASRVSGREGAIMLGCDVEGGKGGGGH
jgi:hypothetical protein